ncbi:hypothetical protein L596_017866 [Steinernema carpocapsae]|uniref:Uncharacterized protein n=1 Tax=Steinernema carpocapsae TaxID=34508 RepID=A0A4U5N3M5_STECR|nr:hypothetical protein L596_017866 [Steinernema carpocapsae]
MHHSPHAASYYPSSPPISTSYQHLPCHRYGYHHQEQFQQVPFLEQPFATPERNACSAPVSVFSPLQLDVAEQLPLFDPRGAQKRKISAAYSSCFYSPQSICSSVEPSSKIQTPQQSSFDAPASQDTDPRCQTASTLSSSGLSGSLENIHMEDLFNTPDQSPINVSTPTQMFPEGTVTPQQPPPPGSSSASTTGYRECDELSLPSSSSVFPDSYLPSSRNPRLDQRSKSLITETDQDLERLLDQMLEQTQNFQISRKWELIFDELVKAAQNSQFFLLGPPSPLPPLPATPRRRVVGGSSFSSFYANELLPKRGRSRRRPW